MSPRDLARASAVGTAIERLRASAPALRLGEALLAGLGGALTIFALGWAGLQAGTLLLIAPFGASCVLAFAIPQSPLAQPRNVVGGHLISTMAGLIVLGLFGVTPLGLALGVGLAIASMVLTGTLHPPAGADPIVVMLAAASWSFLFVPVLLGAATIVLVAIAYHRLVTGKTYPTRP